METQYFVHRESIVRQIWGQSDTILFIFAGAAAEFALNKAVDWLYFTRKLPKDPLGRLFSTVSYAQLIVFSENQTALRTIDAMAAVHTHVEAKRGQHIPEWAYRDVLYMLIDYSIRSYELLERKLSGTEKEEVFEVFTRMGNRMGLKGLPETYASWLDARQQCLASDLQRSQYTHDLFRQYKKHLGAIRYLILKESQKLVVPLHVRQLLDFRKPFLFRALISLYTLMRRLKLDWMLKALILPKAYKRQVEALSRVTEKSIKSESGAKSTTSATGNHAHNGFAGLA